jgi:hypothetical protein
MEERLENVSGFTGAVLPKSAIELAYQVVQFDGWDEERHIRTVHLVAAGLVYGYQIAVDNTKAPSCEDALTRRARTVAEVRKALGKVRGWYGS